MKQLTFLLFGLGLVFPLTASAQQQETDENSQESDSGNHQATFQKTPAPPATKPWWQKFKTPDWMKQTTPPWQNQQSSPSWMQSFLSRRQADWDAKPGGKYFSSPAPKRSNLPSTDNRLDYQNNQQSLRQARGGNPLLIALKNYTSKWRRIASDRMTFWDNTGGFGSNIRRATPFYTNDTLVHRGHIYRSPLRPLRGAPGGGGGGGNRPHLGPI